MLVLVERPEHVSRALELAKERPAAKLAALSPEVMAALERAGRSYVVPEDYVGRDALYRRGQENYEGIEALGVWLDERLASLPENLRLNPVFLNFYQLKVLLDSVGLRAMELAALLRAERAGGAVVLRTEGDEIWARRGVHFLAADGPIYGAVAPLVAAALSMPCEIVSAAADSAPASAESSLRTTAARARAALRLGGAALARKGAIWQIGDASHDEPLLEETLGGSLPITRWGNAFSQGAGGLLAALAGPSPKDLDGEALASLWRELEGRLSALPLFRYDGVDCFPLVRGTLQRLLTSDQLETARAFHGLKRFIAFAKPAAAFAVNTPLRGNIAAAAALKASGVPVVYLQEGGLCGYCETPMHHYCELSWGDHLIAYGSGPANWFQETRLTPRQRARALPAGSLRLRRLSERRASRGSPPAKPVMYVTSTFSHALRYAPLCYGDREYYRLRRRTLEALLASGADIIYKAAPGSLSRDALLPFLREHAGKITVTDEPLSSVLDRAGSFALDWPTTTLLELLTTDKPVDVLLDRTIARPLEPALALLRRRARVFLEPELFIRALAEAPGTRAEDLGDRSFLETFGTAGAAAWSDAQFVEFFRGLAPAPDPR